MPEPWESGAPDVAKELKPGRDTRDREAGSSAAPWLIVEEREKQLRLLLLARIAAVSAILAVTLYAQFLAGSTYSLRPLFWIVLLVYVFSLALTVAHYWGAYAWPRFAALQLSFDVVAESLLIYFLGGMQSPFVVLYVLTVVSASLILSPRGAIAIAGLSVICFGIVGIAVLEDSPLVGALPRAFEEALRTGLAGTRVGATDLYLRVFVLMIVTYAVARLSSVVAARLRQTGQELRSSRSQVASLQELNERIIQGMSGGLLATDLGGRVVTVNSAAEEITGQDAAALMKRPIWEIFGQEHDFLARIAGRLREKRMYRTERTLRAGDGRLKSIGMTATRLADAANHDGDRGLYVFMFQDLTEIKRMEQELRIRDRMSVLGEMAGSIAHEIRNPLASISGSLQLLARSNLRSDNPDAEDLVGIVVKESNRLSKTIDEFLEYARPGPFHPEETDLRSLIDETFALLRNSPELRRDHRLEVECEHEDCVAAVDPGQIKQVFWNLARNAIQAMPEGGKVLVRLRRTRAGIEVAFEDNGAGMTADEIETFFQPYVSGRTKGTGLGLAIVYRILERHGVAIEVDSEPGKGTNVRLVFRDQATEDGDQMVLIGGKPETAVSEENDESRIDR